MNRYEDFMHIALREAEAVLETGNLPVGAVVILNDEVVGMGGRISKASRKLDHAETIAVKQAFAAHRKETEQMTLYTTLEPCLMCMGTALNVRIHKIVYAFPDDYGGATNIPVDKLPVRHQDNKFEVIRDVCRGESQKLLREFFETTDQKFWQNRDNPLVKAAFAD